MGSEKLEHFFDTPFLVLYGDNYYQFDPAPLIELHVKNHALATIATFTTSSPTGCGLVGTDSSGRVTRFVEKPPAEDVFTDQANAGVYILEPEVLSLIPGGVSYDFGRDVFPALLREFPGRLYATPLNGYLRDTGTPENYRQANWDAVELHGEPAIAPDAIIEPGATLVGRNIIGAGCQIQSGASVQDSILWDGVVVEAGARVEGAVLGHGVIIASGVHIPPGTLIASGEKVER
ncbi:MAG: NDP-sugar synthase [Armatimonas sp.]